MTLSKDRFLNFCSNVEVAVKLHANKISPELIPLIIAKVSKVRELSQRPCELNNKDMHDLSASVHSLHFFLSSLGTDLQNPLED